MLRNITSKTGSVAAAEVLVILVESALWPPDSSLLLGISPSVGPCNWDCQQQAIKPTPAVPLIRVSS